MDDLENWSEAFSDNEYEEEASQLIEEFVSTTGGGAPDESPKLSPSKLLEQLGDDDFDTREGAHGKFVANIEKMSFLQAIGKGLRSRDLEVKSRCERIVGEYLKNEFGMGSDVTGAFGLPYSHREAYSLHINEFMKSPKDVVRLQNTLDGLGISERHLSRESWNRITGWDEEGMSTTRFLGRVFPGLVQLPPPEVKAMSYVQQLSALKKLTSSSAWR